MLKSPNSSLPRSRVARTVKMTFDALEIAWSIVIAVRRRPAEPRWPSLGSVPSKGPMLTSAADAPEPAPMAVAVSGAGPLVEVERPRDHVAVVTLRRPERLNAMSIDLVIELYDALDAVAADNDTWVVVLTGSGRAFCSGLDLKDYGVVPNIDGLQVGRIAQRSMRHYCRLVPPAASHAAAGHRGGQRPGLRRRHVPGHRRRPPVRRQPSATFNSTGIVNGLTSTELGVSWLLPRLDRRRAVQRPPAHRPGRRRGRGAGDGAGVAGACRTTSCSTRASTSPRRCAASAPTAWP